MLCPEDLFVFFLAYIANDSRPYAPRTAIGVQNREFVAW